MNQGFLNTLWNRSICFLGTKAKLISSFLRESHSSSFIRLFLTKFGIFKMHLYVCMYICVCIYMFVCLCIHTHRFVSIGFIFPLKLSSTSSNLLTQNIYANQLLTPKIHL
jgi:hypothetical protein